MEGKGSDRLSLHGGPVGRSPIDSRGLACRIVGAIVYGLAAHPILSAVPIDQSSTLPYYSKGRPPGLLTRMATPAPDLTSTPTPQGRAVLAGQGDKTRLPNNRKGGIPPPGLLLLSRTLALMP
jgi:hypothetical protein